MRFTEKYDWMYRRATTNLRLDERDFFKNWWEALGERVDEEKDNL